MAELVATLPAQDGAPPRGRLLLVEDNPANRELTRVVLEHAGHIVQVVSDGAKALRAAAEGNYDLILTDIQMPEMDGLAATRAIRDLPGDLGAIPIIGMSAAVLPAQVRQCREAGMDDHVGKPFHSATLSATLARWLVGNGREPAKAASFAMETLDELAAKMSPKRLRQVLAFIEAELSVAFAYPVDASEDRDRIRRDAHSLASAAGMAGFTAVTESCRVLEALDEAPIEALGILEFDAALARARSIRDSAREMVGI